MLPFLLQVVVVPIYDSALGLVGVHVQRDVAEVKVKVAAIGDASHLVAHPSVEIHFLLVAEFGGVFVAHGLVLLL